MRLITIASTALALSLCVPDVDAQLLDGEWFKVTASFAGDTFDKEADKSVRIKVKPITAWGQAVLSEGSPLEGPTYGLELIGIVDGVLYGAGGMQLSLNPDERSGVSEVSLFEPDELVGEPGSPPGRALEGVVVVRGAVKAKDEELKSARLRAYAGYGAGTPDVSGDVVGYGGIKLTLSRVPVNKLPFDPESLSLLAPPAPESDVATFREKLKDALDQAGAPKPVAPSQG